MTGARPPAPGLDAAAAREVQSLVLRRPPGPAVRHLLLRVPAGRGLAARAVLRAHCAVSFGVADVAPASTCSLGFSHAGLEALCLPEAYLRVFQRLAPAFRSGAVRRSTAVGDTGPSGPARWHPAFAQDRAHVVVSWHGRQDQVDAASRRLVLAWCALLPASGRAAARQYLQRFRGHRLPTPPGEQGDWAHFGFRDDVSDVAIDRLPRAAAAPDLRQHAAGALLLGWADDEGLNRFALTQAPAAVRRFFRNASFGILRRMAQDVAAFEAEVAGWQTTLAAVFDPVAPGERRAHPDLARAKLCGRWPDGRAVRPGARMPPAAHGPAEYRLDLYTEDATGRVRANDAQGTGCPFGSHVRRLQAQPDADGNLLRRPLARRSVPFGPPARPGAPDDAALRGHWGHFFCADIENQFEHLLGQWAARPLLAARPGDDALDPFVGAHDDPRCGLRVPLEGRAAQRLTGFRPCTTTLGTAYAWYPAREGLRLFLENDVVPEELAGPWL